MPHTYIYYKSFDGFLFPFGQPIAENMDDSLVPLSFFLYYFCVFCTLWSPCSSLVSFSLHFICSWFVQHSSFHLDKNIWSLRRREYISDMHTSSAIVSSVPIDVLVRWPTLSSETIASGILQYLKTFHALFCYKLFEWPIAERQCEGDEYLRGKKLMKNIINKLLHL